MVCSPVALLQRLAFRLTELRLQEHTVLPVRAMAQPLFGNGVLSCTFPLKCGTLKHPIGTVDPSSTLQLLRPCSVYLGMLEYIFLFGISGIHCPTKRGRRVYHALIRSGQGFPSTTSVPIHRHRRVCSSWPLTKMRYVHGFQ